MRFHNGYGSIGFRFRGGRVSGVHGGKVTGLQGCRDIDGWKSYLVEGRGVVIVWLLFACGGGGRDRLTSTSVDWATG